MMRLFLLLLSLVWGTQSYSAQTSSMIAQQLFDSPEKAVQALRQAVHAQDKTALRALFGPDFHDLQTGDAKLDSYHEKKFSEMISRGCTLVKNSDDKVTIEVGQRHWPMPIPVVKINGQWLFDTAAGKEEIINRHIGKDELFAISICRTFKSDLKLQRHLGRPYRGYYFRRLPHGTLLAYPVSWGHSGIMAFIAGNDGKVYQCNFGPQTPQMVPAIKTYNPDSRWTLVTEQGVNRSQLPQ